MSDLIALIARPKEVLRVSNEQHRRLVGGPAHRRCGVLAGLLVERPR